VIKIAIMGSIHEDGWKNLKQLNYDVFEIIDFTKENLIQELQDVDAVALRTAELSEDVLIYCPKIKIISRHGVGYDNVDLNFLNKHKMALAVTGTSNAISVAEHVMTMFLYLSKKINLSDNLVRTNQFTNKNSIGNFFELYKKNILILGFGRIGRALAQRCKGFEANILVYDPFVNKEIIEDYGYKKVDFDFGITQADLITIHMPLSNQTKNLISKKEFEKMKNNVIIVNTARGGIINEKDLYWALKNRKIFGAGIDVYETEPPKPDNALFTLDNILLSPHNAALTLECRKRMSVETFENILFYLENNKKLNKGNIVNKEIVNL
jgi:D-3-phosphoglycerate dehydrogenase